MFLVCVMTRTLEQKFTTLSLTKKEDILDHCTILNQEEILLQ